MPEEPYSDVFVAVHGIGAQQRNATLRAVGTRFARSKTLRDGKEHPLAPQPLGYFHFQLGAYKGIQNASRASLLDRDGDFAEFYKKAGFAEVFWADIPQDVVNEKRTLEETKAWAHTVVARAERLCRKAKPAQERIVAKHRAQQKVWQHEVSESKVKGGSAPQRPEEPEDMSAVVPPDFSLAGEVLDEIIDTVHVIENLTYLADKAGVFTFDVETVLNEFLGDVQFVTEFTDVRNNILGSFHRGMRDLFREQKSRHDAQVAALRAHDPQAPVPPFDLNLHIVAHSEGTVIAYLGLLYALRRQAVRPYHGWGEYADERAPLPDAGMVAPQVLDEASQEPGELDWVKYVRSFMTIGSPIDKHLLLWEHLWTPFAGLRPDTKDAQGNTVRHGWRMDLLSPKIRWRNYYDYGDPVGFKLDTVRKWLQLRHCENFEFEEEHDIGFARYVLPGKAHNDYWDDAEVFEHFIKSVVRPPQNVRAVPPSRWDLLRNAVLSRAGGAHLFLLRCVSPRRADAVRDEWNTQDMRRASGAPPDRFVAEWFSFLIPYGISFLILLTGCALLYKNVTAFMHPGLDPVQRYVRFRVLGTQPEEGVSGLQLIRYATGFACLVAGTTLFSRLPRLVRGQFWSFLSALSFLFGCFAYAHLIGHTSQVQIGLGLPDLVHHLLGPRVSSWLARLYHWLEPFHLCAPTFCVFTVALLVGAIGWFFKAGKSADPDARRQLIFRRGMRPLILTGVAGALLIIGAQIWEREHMFGKKLDLPGRTAHFFERAIKKDKSLEPLRDEVTRLLASELVTRGQLDAILTSSDHPNDPSRINTFKSLVNGMKVITIHPPFWPVILALIAFFYLWWLAAMLFDLTFVWHYYIRHNKTNLALLRWKKLQWADPNPPAAPP